MATRPPQWLLVGKLYLVSQLRITTSYLTTVVLNPATMTQTCNEKLEPTCNAPNTAKAITLQVSFSSRYCDRSMLNLFCDFSDDRLLV